jgi:hypothetical protein
VPARKEATFLLDTDTFFNFRAASFACSHAAALGLRSCEREAYQHGLPTSFIK